MSDIEKLGNLMLNLHAAKVDLNERRKQLESLRERIGGDAVFVEKLESYVQALEDEVLDTIKGIDW